MTDLSIFNIFSYILLALSSLIVASIVKNRFKIAMFRLGVILNFVYIMAIIILQEKIMHHLGLISILYGISNGIYYFPYNLFVINKVDNKNRIEFMVKSKIVSSTIGILCPIVLGSVITITNYELTAIIIAIISVTQILLSFLLKTEKDTQLSKFNLKRTWKSLCNNQQIKKMCIVEFFIGMNVSNGALEVLMTILIFNSFKTDMNLGIISSITTILTIIFVNIYGKRYKNKNDNKIIILPSILPVISLLLLLICRNNVTLILYNFCYVIFTALLTLTREIRLFNLADSSVVDRENQTEFFSGREFILNLGRVTGYLMLLLAGVTGNQIVLNIVMILLTLSILIMGLNIRKIKKFEQ
ncbi:MAG: MFS transporter [Clostridia bacterium]|nr:MFS transporter [Clostridia bacterium]